MLGADLINELCTAPAKVLGRKKRKQFQVRACRLTPCYLSL
jgi:hypothetical protein